jgi:membrane protein DedA with SNARE-associated domain
MDAWIQPLIDALMSLDGLTIYGIGFAVLLACGFGLPIPEDITLLLMGYMTYHPMPDGGARPHAHVAVAVVVGLLGVMIGDGCMFTLGRRYGDRLIDRWPFRMILGDGRLPKATEFLQRNGAKVLFSARFTPGLRSVVFFTSGTLGIPLGRFLLYDGLAALLSVPALVVSAWYWGAQFDEVVARARQAENGLLIVIVVVALALVARALLKRREAARAG